MRLPAAIASPPDSEFQKFVLDATGKRLPIFGSEFFNNGASTFAPILNTPVPADYTLGPGDEVLIRGWGTIDIDYRALIDRNGLIAVPSIGTIVLGGVKAGDAEEVVRGAIGKFYKDVTLNVTFGQLRALTVYVVGQARRPGTYTVSSLSTLVTALFASGGPNPNGSMRHIQVRRAGKTVAELDLYAFIAKGDKSSDIKLQDGDTIYIPAAEGFVALSGKVNNPAIYELRAGSDTVGALLDLAGGMSIVANPHRAFLERLDPKQRRPRTVEEFALDGDGLKKPLKSGDLLSVISITPSFENSVTLRGNVDQPIRVPFKPGMRVADLIPSREYLVTRASLLKRNGALMQHEKESAESIAAQIGGVVDQVNWEYAVVERFNPTDLSVDLIPFNLGKIFDNPAGFDNLELQAGDVVTVFSQNDVRVPIEKRRVLVRVEGEVNAPGIYQMKPGETLIDLIARAGGPTSNAYLFGTEFYREQVRKEQRANIERALRRLEVRLQSLQSQDFANTGAQGLGDAQFALSKRQIELQAGKEAIARLRELKPTGRISFGLNPEDRSFNKLPSLKLEGGDQLFVPSKPDFVHLYGAVNQEASRLWRPGLTVGKCLDEAGLTSDADLEEIFVLRADGSVLSAAGKSWLFNGLHGVEVMPGDSIVVPEKFSKETAWTRFIAGAKDWAQIFSSLGLGAAAIKTLR